MKKIYIVSTVAAALAPLFAFAEPRFDERAGIASALGFGIVITAVVILVLVSLWKVFEKAGKPGWAAIIPIYNIIVMLQIVGLSPWLVLLCFVPFVNYVFGIYLTYRLARSFGKGIGFTVGLVLLQVVFLPILAFGDAQYLGPDPVGPVAMGGEPVTPQNSTSPVDQNPTV